jgi:amino acid adenylation domain-containing protein
MTSLPTSSFDVPFALAYRLEGEPDVPAVRRAIEALVGEVSMDERWVDEGTLEAEIARVAAEPVDSEGASARVRLLRSSPERGGLVIRAGRASLEARAALETWRRHLDGAPRYLELPVDRPRPERPSGETARVHATVPEVVMRRANEVAAAAGSALDDVLLAAYALLLTRWTGQDDVVIGATAPGLFPLSVATASDDTFATLVRRVRDERAGASEVATVGLDELVAALAPADPAPGRRPIVQTMFARAAAPPPLDLEGLVATPVAVQLHPPAARYELACLVHAQDDGATGLELSYATDTLTDATMVVVARRLAAIIDQATAAPHAALRTLDLLPHRERERLLEWGRGPNPEPWNRSIPERFWDVAAERAADPALVVAGETLTFNQVQQQAATVTAALRADGVSGIIGVSTTRDRWLLSNLLGVLGAGCAYLPLDPGYPPERLHGLCEDLDVAAVVAPHADAHSLAGALRLGIDVLACDALPPADDVLQLRPTPVAPQDLAYVIPTSGTTGKPKSVGVPHRAMTALLDGLEITGVVESDAPAVVAWNASASFDASVQQWTRIARGDTLLLLTEDQRRDVVALNRALSDAGASVLDLTPSLAEAVIDDLEVAPLRLLVGGEAISDELWSRLRALEADNKIEAYNLYGPTECGVDATTAAIAETERPTIGTPLPGVRAYILDKDGTLCPEGAFGELHLAGVGLAHGYLDRPEETARRFVDDTIARDGSRMYATGDRVRWRDGRIEIAGRLDRQLKVRGYRLEPEEIEAAITSLDGIRRAVVVARPTATGATLAAYWTGEGKRPADELRDAVAARLPSFMVPQTFMWLERLPTDRSGKVALAQLPEPDASPAEDGTARDRSDLDDLERTIAEVWADVLGVGAVTADDDFFSLGGHSLLAIRVASRLKKRLGVTIPMNAVFEHPNVRELAAFARPRL